MTLAFLESLETQTVDELIKIVIIDDGSTDGSSEQILKRTNLLATKILHGSGRLWWSGSVWKGLKWVKTRASSEDWIFLANNDTLLDPNCLKFLIESAEANPGAIIGGRSFEVWPDKSLHPVSSGFTIDRKVLTVTAIDGSCPGIHEVQALAGRGLLIPASALPEIQMRPHLMPQHFADIAMTSNLREMNRTLLVDHRAVSTQIDRAGSAVEIGEIQRPSWSKGSALFIPGLLTFWWQQLPARERPALLFRLARRAIPRR